MAKFDYRKTQFKNKQTESIDTIYRDKPKKLTKAQKLAKQKRGQKTSFIKEVAKKLQTNTPRSEVWFKTILQEHNIDTKFLSNIPLNDMIPDFINLDKRIVIEIDGNVHNNQQQIQRDLKKDREYTRLGYTCFRVIAYDEDQAERVIKQLLEIL